MDDKYEVIEIKPSPSNNTTLKRSKVRLYGSRIQTEDD